MKALHTAHLLLLRFIYFLIPLYTSVTGYDFDIDMMRTRVECGCEFLMFMGGKWDRGADRPDVIGGRLPSFGIFPKIMVGMNAYGL